MGKCFFLRVFLIEKPVLPVEFFELLSFLESKVNEFQPESLFFFSSTDTEVFVVSSSLDAHSTFVYPTAPYAMSPAGPQYKNVTFLPDPCIIKLNGVTIGMTATDIYSHISDAEIAV